MDKIETSKKIGQFKTKIKFVDFIGMRGNINFIDNEALIEGKYLSGLDIEDVMFKLTICDENTVNFDEVDTNRTTVEQRERLLDVINERTIIPYNKKMVIKDLPFKSIKKIADKEIDLYLTIEYNTPISKLASFFEDIEVSEDQSSKLENLLSMFDDESPLIEEMPLMKEENIIIDSKIEKTESQKIMEESFKKLKDEKLKELQSRLEYQKSELKKHEYEKIMAEKKIDTVNTEIKVLGSRIDSLMPKSEPNGYYFSLSERLNEKVTLEDDVAQLIRDKVSKVKSINVDAFMKLFEAGEFNLKLGIKNEIMTEVVDYNNLPENIKKSLSEIGFTLVDDKLSYLGEMSWHDLVDKLIKVGFSQDPEFDKMAGSNSYFAMYGQTGIENTNAEEINNNNMIKKFNEHQSFNSKISGFYRNICC